MRMSETASCVNLNQADDVHLELLLTNQHCEPSPKRVRTSADDPGSDSSSSGDELQLSL